MAKRVMARVPDDIGSKIVTWSERFGITQSQLCGMAIQAGLGSILRAISPEESMTPDQWAKIVRAMQDQGLTGEQPGRTDA